MPANGLASMAHDLHATFMRLGPALLVLLVLAGPLRAQDSDCTQPVPVCAARDAVFAISAFDPAGTAVRIGDDLLITARHVIADSDDIAVFLPDGSRLNGDPVPTDYAGDIQLVRVDGLPPGPVLTPGKADSNALLYTVGADISRGKVVAYDPGPVALLPADGRPLARLHHSAFSQPGNSGGAIVDRAGSLIAIVASGGEGRHEGVPADAIAALMARSGPEYTAADARIGTAIRDCTLLLERFRDPSETLDSELATTVEGACRRTGNRQFFDLAAQTFGTRGLLGRAISLFESSLDQDPNALNSRIGMAITLHTAARFEDELPHLRFLLDQLPEDPQVIRLAIQAGTWAGDTEMAAEALETLNRINPNLAVRAQQFVDNPPPRPEPRL